MKKSFFIFMVLLMGCGLFVIPQSRAYTMHPLMNQQMKEVALEDQQSQAISLKTVVAQKKSIVVFWTTWCPHCRSTIKDLVKKEKNLQGNQIQVVLVNISENKNKVLNFLKEAGVTDSFIVLFDATQEAALAYRVQGIPVMFFMTEEGRIAHIDGRLPAQYQEIFSKKH